MSLRSRRFVRLLLPVIAAMCLSAAPQQQLNPTVKVLPAAVAPVPTECEEGLAPQPQPRITPEEKAVAQEIIAAPEMKAPPTKDLRSMLGEVQATAESNDRSRFVDALARLRTMLATYPTGGERTAGERIVAVYDDLDRLWTYQLTPAGAFFDSSSDAYRIVSQYPGYDDFIRRQILTDRIGAKFYPTAESRAFLAQVAATRLKDFGIRSAAAASTPTTAPVVPAAEPATKRVEAQKPAAGQHVEHRVEEQPKVPATKPAKRHHEVAPAAAGGATQTTSRAKPPKSAAATSATKRAATTAAKSGVTKKPAPAPKASEAAPATAPTTKLIAAPTATASSYTTKTPAQPSATSAATGTEPGETVTTATTALPPASASTATAPPAAEPTLTETTGTSPAAKPSGKPNEPRNLLMPIILIVIGVGVLILLFRTSPGK